MAITQSIYEKERHAFDQLYKTVLKDGKLMFAGRLLQRAVAEHGDTVALIYNDRYITYKKLYALACALSKKIVEKYNLKPRDKAIICFENSPEFYIAYFALWQAGIIVAPVNTFLKQTELSHIIAHAQPAIIMTSSDRVELFEKTGIALPPIVT